MTKLTKLLITGILSLLLCLTIPTASLAQTPGGGSKKPKIALTLGGGGARGAAHVGVLKVLEENGLKPDLVVGNSMGAIVGGMYCAGVPLEKIELLIRDGKVKKAFKPVPPVIQVFKKLVHAFKFWGQEDYPGFYSGKALEKFIREQVGEDRDFIEKTSPKFACTAVDLIDGKAYRLEDGELARAVRASSSFPPLLKPVPIEDHVFTDGGVRSNVPTFSAKGMGADYIIAVNVDEKVETIDKEQIKSYTELVNRLSSIIIFLRDKELLKQADLVIQPDVSGISVLSVEQDDYAKAVKAGEEAARKALPELKKAFAARDRGSLANKDLEKISTE
ncbi:MAG: patatin-like phospholipase family protein [Candidatus Obscuribacterales bacterium]|nr:patatin-like phospholipase family protein [Candidatus Obscuribacterales bacterium]